LSHAPPVARLALAFAVGAAWALNGIPPGVLPLAALAFLLAPIGASRWPARLPWLAMAVAGAGYASLGVAPAACPAAPASRMVALEGRFLATPYGGSAPFVPSSACGPVTVVVPDSLAPAGTPAGTPVRVVGSWRDGRMRPWFLARSVEPATPAATGSEARWVGVRWRDDLTRRIHRLYGERGPLVAALTLARTEGFDRDIRETFARTGIAHLLSISGFHVGVVAGMALALLTAARLRGRRAELGAAAFACVYVALIGFPDAASRAALMLCLVVMSRVRRRPPARWGALSGALLILVLVDPAKLMSPGFQLSFAGAAGLVAWAGPLTRTMQRVLGRRCPRALALGVAAGVAATLATLPVVAWHFERLSLVGIPATMVGGPLVALALPGAIASVVVDFISPGAASFLAGGVSLLLAALETGAERLAAVPWASVWITRATVVAGVAGVLIGGALVRRPQVRGTARRATTLMYVASAVASWPLLLALQGRGSVEVLMIDVGQGDAIALRGSGGRWLLVDAGPPGAEGDPGAHPAVRALRARGVRRLEALVLTHADLDHIGGAAAVLSSFEVGAVYDPALPAGKEAFVEALALAARRGVPWRPARAGDRLEVDGLSLRVLAPSDSAVRATSETNALSVVLEASYGEFDVLLTGDVSKDVERLVAGELAGGLEVLKVAHHGSDTSTDSLLLARGGAELALVSVGRYNRYGHPAPAVLARLRRAGLEVRRTDHEGTVSVRARRDGSYTVEAERRR
jgi:competence protein ComEC